MTPTAKSLERARVIWETCARYWDPDRITVPLDKKMEDILEEIAFALDKPQMPPPSDEEVGRAAASLAISETYDLFPGKIICAAFKVGVKWLEQYRFNHDERVNILVKALKYYAPEEYHGNSVAREALKKVGVE